MYCSTCLVCWTPLQSALIDLPPWTLDAAWPLQQPASNWSCSTAVDSHGTLTLHVCVSVCVCLPHLPLAGLLAARPTLLTSPLHSQRIQRPYGQSTKPVLTCIYFHPSHSSLIYSFLYSPQHLSNAWWNLSPLGQVSFRLRREFAWWSNSPMILCRWK